MVCDVIPAEAGIQLLVIYLVQKALDAHRSLSRAKPRGGHDVWVRRE